MTDLTNVHERIDDIEEQASTWHELCKMNGNTDRVRVLKLQEQLEEFTARHDAEIAELRKQGEGHARAIDNHRDYIFRHEQQLDTPRDDGWDRVKQKIADHNDAAQDEARFKTGDEVRVIGVTAYEGMVGTVQEVTEIDDEHTAVSVFLNADLDYVTFHPIELGLVTDPEGETTAVRGFKEQIDHESYLILKRRLDSHLDRLRTLEINVFGESDNTSTADGEGEVTHG